MVTCSLDIFRGSIDGTIHDGKLRRDNLTFRVYPSALLEENKWRAVRYGLDGKLIDFGKEEEKPARELIREMLQWFLEDVVDEDGSWSGDPAVSRDDRPALQRWAGPGATPRVRPARLGRKRSTQWHTAAKGAGQAEDSRGTLLASLEARTTDACDG